MFLGTLLRARNMTETGCQSLLRASSSTAVTIPGSERTSGPRLQLPTTRGGGAQPVLMMGEAACGHVNMDHLMPGSS